MKKPLKMRLKNRLPSFNVVGAGLAGLATCYHLKQAFPQSPICLYDKQGIGAGASGIASGLLHPYPGPTLKPVPQALEALHEALKLIHFSKTAIYPGIYRLAKNDSERKKLALLSQRVPAVSWLPPTLTIRNGYTLDTLDYLHNLFKALDLPLVCEAIEKPEILQGITILTVGAAAQRFSPALQVIKGQRIDVEMQSHSIIADGYLAVTAQRTHFGATYEHHFANAAVDRHAADTILRPKWEKLSLGPYRPLNYQSALRCTQKGLSEPLICRLNEGLYLYTALGSRGLLHHAYYAKKLVNQLYRDYTAQI